MNLTESVSEILCELNRAENIHPEWPQDIIHQLAIMVEEAGETLQAGLNHYYHDEKKMKIQRELVQTGAMVLRCLKNIDWK